MSAASHRSSHQPGRGKTVALFVTCLVDLFRPSIALAAVKLLEDAGCRVVVPDAQTCCGQPAYNSGDRRNARALAVQVIAAFERFDHVVVPSGSCGGMIAHHFPALFDDDPKMRTRAEALAGKTHELISFLVDVLGLEQVTARYQGTVTYHDSWRRGLFGSRVVERLASVNLYCRLVSGGAEDVLWVGQGKSERLDIVPQGKLALLEGRSYPFVRPELKRQPLSRLVEPVLVSGIIGGLVYLFYSNQD